MIDAMYLVKDDWHCMPRAPIHGARRYLAGRGRTRSFRNRTGPSWAVPRREGCDSTQRMVAPTSRGCAEDLQEGAEKARQESDSDRTTSSCGGSGGGGGTVVRTHRALPRRRLSPKLLSSSSHASHRSRGHAQSRADECSSRRSSQGGHPLESPLQGPV